MDGSESYEDNESATFNELAPIHNIHKALFFVLNRASMGAEEVMREAQSYPPSEFRNYIKPLKAHISSVLKRAELGTLAPSTKRINKILSDLKHLKAHDKVDNHSAAGVLLPVAESFLEEVFEIAQRANELQFAPCIPSNQPKNASVSHSADVQIFLGFNHCNGGPLFQVNNESLRHAFTTIYGNPYLKSKFVNPTEGLGVKDLKVFNISISKKDGRSRRNNHPIFESNIVIGEKRAGDPTLTWHLNPEYTFSFTNSEKH